MPNINGIVVIKFLMIFAGGILAPDLSLAQVSSSDERGAESDAAHEMKFDETEAAIEMGGNVDGVVISVGPRSIAVQDVDEDGQTYVMNVKSATTYEGADSLSDISVGDTVGVDYYGLSGNLIAEEIVVKSRAYKEEELPKLEKVLSD
jgi:hypothetical protein